MLQDVQPLGIGGHEAVLDTVVDHFDEMSRARRAAMQVTLFSGAADFFAAGSAVDVATSRGQRFEDGIETLHNLGLAADHLAVAAFESPYAAARAHVNIVQPFGRQFFRSADIVDVVGISAINHDVAGIQLCR